MLSYSFTIIMMHVVTVTNGRNCGSFDQIERPTDTINIHESNLPLKDSPGNQRDQTNQIPDQPRPRNRCCPYNFDSKLCQVVNDRLLCGYNRNVGRPANNGKAFSLSGGCRLRGGRLECGYDHGPFTNARRPPGWDEAPHFDENIIVAEESLQPDNPVTNTPVILGSHENDEYQNQLKLYLDQQKMKATPRTYKLATKCLEIRERVVCKTV